MYYMNIICNTVFAKELFDIASGKMYPVYFGLVHAIVVIPLFFFGAVYDHIAGRNDFFFTVKEKMSLAGCNI